MGSNSEAAKKYRDRMLEIDPNYFKKIGSKGGAAPHKEGVGYGSDKVGPDGLTGKERSQKLAESRKKSK